VRNVSRRDRSATAGETARVFQHAAACEQAVRFKPEFELARNNLRFAQEMAKAHSK